MSPLLLRAFLVTSFYISSDIPFYTGGSGMEFSRWVYHLCVCIADQLCPTLCDPMDVAHQASLPMGILQARILEWVTVSSSRGSSQPRDRTQVSLTVGGFFMSGQQGSPGLPPRVLLLRKTGNAC